LTNKSSSLDRTSFLQKSQTRHQQLTGLVNRTDASHQQSSWWIVLSKIVVDRQEAP